MAPKAKVLGRLHGQLTVVAVILEGGQIDNGVLELACVQAQKEARVGVAQLGRVDACVWGDGELSLGDERYATISSRLMLDVTGDEVEIG